MTANTIDEELKQTINQSILNYLHRSGFTKTLKRFQSESKIQSDEWKTSSDHLEDIYSKYVNASRPTEENGVAEPETKSKKKKKNKQDLASGGETEEVKVDAPKKAVDEIVNEPEVKEDAPKEDIVNESEVNETKKKDKKKKSKSNQQDAENGDVKPDEVKEEKKSSKKRKRVLADENENESDKIETNQTVEESKEDKVDETDKPEMDGGEKSVTQKSGKKQKTGSAEPRTINAFQRVKIDQVEFAHEKLQDNSYWAKSGADVGYGAKAEEVLGQVRGRDFRHEKTKKKRGSYRGGQIDLQSHSIKFDYSDEE
ncbi:LIS1 homology motif, SRP40 [Artemisia annua]|uniref:LIS1 homology motif, SRP40 n=1 Tax=Artemisia annua TaxID=35608 RepID=A0A2U1MP91_ARTAN|nr:LIS1 homology motif, SRP40 [Artemisia annua]